MKKYYRKNLQRSGVSILYKKHLKRLFDIYFSLILIVALAPVMMLLAIIVRFNLGSPIIFKQERVGFKGRVFTLYKFRSMTDARDKNGELLSNKMRMTKFSKIFRSTSLDELPELFNILKGDMSFIGPRPLLTEYLPRYTKEQMKRHNVRPGLTSYTAVNGRTSLPWNKRFEMDVWYVNNLSFFLDLKILIKTFIVVLKRENINSNRGKFMGTEKESNKQNQTSFK